MKRPYAYEPNRMTDSIMDAGISLVKVDRWKYRMLTQHYTGTLYWVLTTEGYYDAANDRNEPISHCVPKFVAFGTSPFSIYASSSAN